MALIKCKECGAEVSDRATKCPNCGNCIKKSNKSMLWIILICLLLVLLGGVIWFMVNKSDSTQSIEKTEETNQIDIEYIVEQIDPNSVFGNILYAVRDGEKIKIDEDENGGFDILLVDDFDNNGLKDALIRPCGGWGELAPYFVSANSDGTFTVTESLGQLSNNEPRYEIVDDEKIVFMGNHGFALRNGKAVEVITTQADNVISTWEYDYDTDHESGEVLIVIDLDENGVEDQIVMSEGMFRGLLKVKFIVNGKPICDEIGLDSTLELSSKLSILRTSTNGMHDLLLDEETTAKWNGKEYEISR